MSRCAIGICAAIERVSWADWNEIVAMAPRSYAAAVQGAGATALLLPPDPAAEQEPQRLLDRLDALILSGGSDIDPSLYRQEPVPETTGLWPERDRFEIALASEALTHGMPVLGICRGMQLLNVARGGTLIQHLPDLLGHSGHLHTPGAFGDHEVRLSPGSLAAAAAGAERAVVKSHHHQGVEALGEGLEASGWSVEEGIVEAIEMQRSEHPFALGVLWHPEEEEQSRVVAALADAACEEATP